MISIDRAAQGIPLLLGLDCLTNIVLCATVILYPFQLQARLESGYYRSMQALLHDTFAA